MSCLVVFFPDTGFFPAWPVTGFGCISVGAKNRDGPLPLGILLYPVDCVMHEFSAVLDAEFVLDACTMGLNGFNADIELL